MEKIVLLMFLCCSGLTTSAQVSEGGIPVGYKYFSEWNAVEKVQLQTPDTIKLQAEDAAVSDNIAKSVRYGVAAKVAIEPGSSGSWQSLPDGGKVWMVRIQSPGAYSLSLGLRNINLAPGTSLFIYNKDHSVLLGAFTSKQTYIAATLATEQVKGDELMVEYDVPGTVRIAAESRPFEIERVSHDYKNLGDLMKSFGTSGNCQININCSSGAPFQDIKRGVAAVLADGTDLCSGSMITTANNSGTPYFLTANHCYIMNRNTASWVFRFNWEASGCVSPVNSPGYYSISGATLKASSTKSDFCLVQLSSAPLPAYNITFAGWDRRPIPAASITCISHPGGDIKKIAIAPARVSPVLLPGFDFWQTGTWTLSCPEHGSSGAPMFNQNKKIVGQLYGGPSGCSAGPADMYDYFGKFSTSWEGDGTPETRLKDWLDPANSNADTAELFDPNQTRYDAAVIKVISPATASCQTSFRPRVVIRNMGAEEIRNLKIIYEIDYLNPVGYTWAGNLLPGNTDTVILPSFITTPNTHNIRVYTALPNGLPDKNTANDTASAAFSTPRLLPLSEGFETAAFPPEGWNLDNPDTLTNTWYRVRNAAASGAACMKKDNYTKNDSGHLDHITTPYLNFSAVGTYVLKFSVSYARYDSVQKDSLLIAVSTDCGSTWQYVYGKSDTGLATSADDTMSYIPYKQLQWRRDSVNLSRFAGSGAVRIRFTNVSGYGNNIYIDDINIDQRDALPYAAFNPLVDTNCQGEVVVINNTTIGANDYSWNIQGGIPATSAQANPQVTFPAPGVYSIGLTASNSVGSQSATKTIYIIPAPVPDIAANNNTLSTASFSSYQWYKDGLPVPGANTQDYSYSGNGTYYVLVKTAGGCAGKSKPVVIDNKDTSVTLDRSVVILPNPATQLIEISDKFPDSRNLDIMVYDILGQIIMKEQMVNVPKKTIDISSFANGIYQIHIRKGNEMIVRKLVKQ